MIQGFETREVTDTVVRAFVEGAKGTLHKRSGPSVGQYEKTHWPTYRNLVDKPVCVFGILRGTGDLITQCQQMKHTFYYFDHAYYFKEQKHAVNKILGDRVYRLTKNALSLNYVDKLNEEDYNRINKIKKHIKIKERKKNGEYILVLPPSDHIKIYYLLGSNSWENKVIENIKKYTDRYIKMRVKGTSIPLKEDLKNAHAVVTFQSTAAVDAVLEGVPSFCDTISCANPVSYNLDEFDKLEDPHPIDDVRERWIDSLLANQYTMEELRNGFAWNRLKGEFAIDGNW